ncbi:MAG: AAA family ATPase [Candidatus Portnoybacteria bacterium]|nr:AAA family ATPase [Candidatus Portnoybacteria bacterium]
MAAIPKIVITGGPCAGKTTGMAYLVKHLFNYGFLVFTIPEVATHLFGCGLAPEKMGTPEQIYEFEKIVIPTQFFFEDSLESAAERIYPADKVVILCDGGIKHHKPYFPNGYSYDELLEKEYGYNNLDLLARYLGVVHLLTTAKDKPKIYERKRKNNLARTETLEEAILIDQKIQESWLGHPRFQIIDNSTGFRKKMGRAFAAIRGFLKDITA